MGNDFPEDAETLWIFLLVNAALWCPSGAASRVSCMDPTGGQEQEKSRKGSANQHSSPQADYKWTKNATVLLIEAYSKYEKL